MSNYTYTYYREMVTFTDDGSTYTAWDIENPKAANLDGIIDKFGNPVKKVLSNYIADALPNKLFTTVCGSESDDSIVLILFDVELSTEEKQILDETVADYKALR